MTILRLSNTEIDAVAGGAAGTELAAQFGAIFGNAVKPYKFQALGLILKYAPQAILSLLTFKLF